METVTTYGPEETFRLGERLGKAAQPGCPGRKTPPPQ